MYQDADSPNSQGTNKMKNLHEDGGKKEKALKEKQPKVGARKRGRDDMDREEG